MTVDVDGLGPLVDLAAAVGLVRADHQLDAAWFSDPGAKVSRMLRDEHQRQALLRAADTLLGQGRPVTVDAQGRHWIPLVQHGGVELDAVVAPSTTVTTVGVGARLTTADPTAHATVLVPLIDVPAAGAATLTFATGSGRIEVDADVRLDPAPAHPGDASLAGIAVHADLRTDGTDPHLSVSLQGLQLPGEPAPHDVGLDAGAGDLADQAISLLAGVVQRSVAAASGELAELLALVGISADARIPVLPVADLLTSGAAAWRRWLDTLLASPDAVEAWLVHLAALASHGATVEGATGPDALGQPARIAWTLPGGVHLAAVVVVTRTADAVPQVTLALEAFMERTGALPARIELDATLATLTLGPTPSAVALPDVHVAGRIGRATIATPADLLVDLSAPEAVQVGSLRFGLGLDAQRRPGLLLAAHNVTVGKHGYPVLDLTNPHALADVAGSAVGDLADGVLGRLGAAGDLVTVLLGVRAPALPPGDPPWPVPLTGLPALLADPVGALLAYHRAVLDTARDRYPALLEPLRALLRTAALDVPVTGSGTADDPWRLALDDGVAVLAWTEGTAPVHLHLAVGVDRQVVDLAGSCPTVTLDLHAEVVDVALDGSGGHAVPGLHAGLVLGARGGVPLRLGDTDTALVADRIGVALDWAPGRSLGAGLVAPGLAATIDGESVPFSLPTLQPDGSLPPDVPWRALELLAGHVLTRSGLPWATDLAGLAGWLPRTGSPGGGGSTTATLPLKQLVGDPVTALTAWARALVADGLLADLARRVALLLTGEAVPGVAAGVLSGAGTARSPFVLPLVGAQADAALRAEVLLWGRDLDPDLGAFRSATLLAALTGAAAPGGPTGGDLAAALLAAAAQNPDVRDALLGRDGLADGLEGLVARWAGTDGLVRAVDVTLPGAVLVDVPDVPAGQLPALDLTALTGVGLEPGTLVASGPLGPTSWPGIPDDHVLDWTAAGLAPEAFDDAALSTGTGPWLVLLPARAAAVVTVGEDGASRQADRLARAVTAVGAALAAGGSGEGVRLVGVGAAGHACVDVAARGGVATLITVGTPHAGIGLDALEVQPLAGTIQLLRALLPAATDGEIQAVRLGRGLLAPLTSAYDLAASPLADLTPPGTVPALPPDLPIWCVRGVCAADSARAAVTGLAVRALQESYEHQVQTQLQAQVPDGGDDGTLHLGVAVTVQPPSAPGEISVRTSAALTREAFGDGAHAGLRLRIEIGRTGGWLAGGPDPTRPADVARHPSVRRADVEVDLAHLGTATARVVLHEAEVFGLARTRWVLSHSDDDADPLMPEALVALSRVAAALAASASPAVTQVTALLAALGLAEPGPAFAFSADGLRRLLVDPAGLLTDVTGAATAPALARALAALVSAPPPAADAPTTVHAAVSGVDVAIDVATGAASLALAELATPLGARLGGRLDLAVDQTLSGTVTVALGAGTGRNGRPVLEVTGGAGAGVVLRWEGVGGGLPAQVRLAPTTDTAALARWVTVVAPAEVLWAGIEFLRSLEGAAAALVDPLLTALGLLDGTGEAARTVVPIGLVADPVRWLARTDPAQLLDTAGAVLGLPRPRPGAWTLPYGLELAAATSGGRTQLILGMDEPVADAGLRVSGSVGIVLATGTLPAAPTLSVDLGVPAATPLAASGRLAVTLGPGGLTARLVVPSAGIDLALLPHGAGLSALGGAAAAAVTYTLPYVLDAVATLPPAHPAHDVGVAVGALGDALDLRSAGHFSGAEIQALAADPAAQFAQRLRHALVDAVQALVDVLSPAMPAGWTVTRDAEDLVVTHTAGTVALTLHVTVPDPGGPAQGVRVAGGVSGVRPFAGASLALGVTADSDGLVEASATFAVDPGSGLDLGPLTLAPVGVVAIGTAPGGGARLSAGLALDGGRQVLGTLRFGPPAAFALEAVGGTLAQTLTELIVPVAVDLALSTAELQALLQHPVLGRVTIAELLDKVVLTGGVFDAGALDPAQLWTRLLQLAANVAGRTPSLPITPLAVGTAHRVDGGDVYGISVTLPPGQRFRLVDSDVTLDVEVDDSWVGGAAGPSGLTLELLKVQGGTPAPFFGLDARGIGLRVGGASGPLLDTFLRVDSVAVHTLFAATAAAGVTDLGGQLELTGLAVGVGSADGGTNKVATGVLRDATSSGEPPRPAFSPALSVQRHGTAPAQVDLRAGTGDGPWWVSLQRSFGPVYIEQVGFGVTRSGERVVAARVLVDGKVTLLGLLVAVDGLALGARWPQGQGDPAPYDPTAWEVGLDGLSVAADTAGVEISGGLRKGPGAAPDYVGMISIRFGVYALSAYGGYAVVTDVAGDFTSLFIYGAVNAPIGGPPAFFVTGLAAGVGINRLLLLPGDLSQFGTYPLLQALDASSSMADPDRALDQLRAYFPPARGAFWFAAGISFTSFALVEGIAVVGVAIGDGLDVNLLGLARTALPTPEFPLVQIELALLVRFSTREGVLWVQGQLTDNSFLLTRDCRLTGGFAYVLWFAGDKAGEFVLTLGGYHPSFHRDGYPVVPRLGYVWGVSDVLVIKGESYFALTSEAVMAGTRFEASLNAGPLWAYLRLGADAIVYFDPFHFQVTAYAELGAGVTVDIDLGWFGHIRITISVHLHADVLLEGPQFHGKATIDLDVTSATVSFGDWSDRSTPRLDWGQFAAKYLCPGGAAVLVATPGRGTLPPGVQGSRKPPTGGADDPYLVLPEFELSVATTAATSAAVAGGPVALPFGVFLAIGPMQTGQVTSTLTVTVTGGGTHWAGALAPAVTTGTFPKGVWGPQPQGEPKPIPTGDTVDAVNGLHLQADAEIATGTKPIDYYQVEVGHRHQLPFLSEAAVRGDRSGDVATAATIAAGTPSTVPAVLAEARTWLTSGARGAALSRYGAAVFAAARSAPPQLVPLAYRMAGAPADPPAVPPAPPAPPRDPDDTSAHPPRVEALLASTPLPPQPRARLTVGERGTGLPRAAARTLAEVRASLDTRLVTRLVVAGAPAAPTNTTLLPTGTAAVTGRAGSGAELREGPGAPPWRAARLDAATQALRIDGTVLLAGEAAVLSSPNGLRDVEPARPALTVKGDLPVRVVVADLGGAVTKDAWLTEGVVVLPPGADRVVVVAGAGPPTGVAGWHATTTLLQTGAAALVGPGCTLRSTAVRTLRAGQPVATGFVQAAQAVAGWSVVTTRLPDGVRSVAVVLESGERVDDDRADALDLGLSGVRRVAGPDGPPLPPAVVVAGARTVSVFAVEPVPVLGTPANGDGEPVPVEVTVASGEHVHLSGVLGATSDAGDLAAVIRDRGVGGAVGPLIPVPSGTARLAWLGQGDAPSADVLRR